MLTFNKHLFLLINAHVGASPAVVITARFLASDVIYFVPALLVVLWVWGQPRGRGGLVATAVAAALALVANQIVGQFWYEPRPFMVGIGRTLMAHAPENSFPSDHATFLFTVGLSLIFTSAAPGWGKVVTATAVLVGWARVYLGVHFPLDILTAAVISILFAAMAALIVSPIRLWIMPMADRAYAAVLDLARLPSSIFPR
jgi:undecaprenyl-diphosphatase